MQGSEHLAAAIKHVRLIHFVLTATSSTVLYILVFAWSDAQIVRGELRELKSLIATVANNDDRVPRGVLPLDWMDRRSETTLQAMESELGITTPMDRVDARQIEMIKQLPLLV